MVPNVLDKFSATERKLCVLPHCKPLRHSQAVNSVYGSDMGSKINGIWSSNHHFQRNNELKTYMQATIGILIVLGVMSPECKIMHSK